MTAVLVAVAAVAGIGGGWAACLIVRRRQWNEAAQWIDTERDDWRQWIERHLRRPKLRVKPLLFDGSRHDDWYCAGGRRCLCSRFGEATR